MIALAFLNAMFTPGGPSAIFAPVPLNTMITNAATVAQLADSFPFVMRTLAVTGTSRFLRGHPFVVPTTLQMV